MKDVSEQANSSKMIINRFERYLKVEKIMNRNSDAARETWHQSDKPFLELRSEREAADRLNKHQPIQIVIIKRSGIKPHYRIFVQ